MNGKLSKNLILKHYDKCFCNIGFSLWVIKSLIIKQSQAKAYATLIQTLLYKCLYVWVWVIKNYFTTS